MGTFSFLEHARHENRREGEGHLRDQKNSGIEHPYQNLPTPPLSHKRETCQNAIKAKIGELFFSEGENEDIGFLPPLFAIFVGGS